MRRSTRSRSSAGFAIDNNRQLLAVTRINRDISEIQLRATISNTLSTVREAYCNYVFTVQAVDAAQQAVDLAQQLFRELRRELTGGQPPVHRHRRDQHRPVHEPGSDVHDQVPHRPGDLVEDEFLDVCRIAVKGANLRASDAGRCAQHRASSRVPISPAWKSSATGSSRAAPDGSVSRAGRHSAGNR
jgi:hypothetical protein